MGRAYHRTIELVTVSPRAVRAELEDDFHHFRVSIAHDGRHVLAVDGDAPRFPWTTCPGAFVPLRRLVGAPVTADATGHGTGIDVREQCTHVFDLAGLAIAQAASDRPGRRYDAVVGPRDDDGRARATLDRDGEPVLAWRVGGHEVVEPPPYAGRPLGRGFLAWARSELDPDTAEAAVVLRRACRISLGHLLDLDAFDRATEVGHGMDGTCHTWQPAQVAVARRVKGATRPA